MIVYYLCVWGVAVGIALWLHRVSRPAPGAPAVSDDKGAAVRKIAGRAYYKMSRAGAPWLWRLSSVASCGGSVPVAVFAIEQTINDLAGRYDTKPLADALNELKTL